MSLVRPRVVQDQRCGAARGFLASQLGRLLAGERFAQALGSVRELGRPQCRVGKALPAERFELQGPRLDQDFSGIQAHEFADPLWPDLHHAGAKRTGRELERSDTSVASGCDQKILRARVERVRLEAKPRRHHAHDLAGDHPANARWVPHLLTNRDLLAVTEERGEVSGGSVMRYAGHWDLAAVGVRAAGRQRDVEDVSRPDRVLVEHLVEVPHPKEDNRVRVLPLGAQELAHDRGVVLLSTRPPHTHESGLLKRLDDGKRRKDDAPDSGLEVHEEELILFFRKQHRRRERTPSRAGV